MDSIDYYEQVGADSFRRYKTGESMPFSQREYLSSDYLFSVDLSPHAEKYIYLRACTSEALLLPLSIGTSTAVFRADKYKDIFWGMYIGLMLAMLLYNCFVYITTKDNNYLYYILYVLTVVITQITISGYGSQLLWPRSLLVARYSALLNPAIVGIAAIEFIRHFLNTKMQLPKTDKLLNLFIALYAISAILVFAGRYSIALNIIDVIAALLSLVMLATGVVMSRRGYRPAVFFLVAWIVFLIGVFIFVFKNFGILPYNNFTVYTMPVGSALEVILLSFALADKINMLKKEVEVSQAKELTALQENERIIQEQNVLLEGKVNERTVELKLSNDGLNKALVELKNAQAQLVESEKMASLGLLTAGIAHEINNPINFVTSQIKPLGRDVQMLMETITGMDKIMEEGTSVTGIQRQAEEYRNDIDLDYLKMEISQLLNGIGEGAHRTAKIVKGLRIFSSLDENDLKKANINEGLDATLAITGNLLDKSITLEKKYAKLPLAECYPGNVNQVFLNIITNAIYAIRKKFGNTTGGLLTITTHPEDGNILIKIADNGTGMDERTKNRLFEPFFTTKDVGEGTGLGLSIAFNIMNSHNGKIEVHSEIGMGTEFIIKLPIIHK